jgi:hypothetical protein
MGDVTGPISTLPGARHDLPEGATCDQHPDRPAVARVQGETDSFGSELWDMCQECLDEHRREMDHSGLCDWCHQHKPRLRPRRDHEEGMYGRVYEVCDDCIKRVEAELALEDDDRFGGYEDDYEDDYDEIDDCGMMPDGQCSLAGTEWCDWECPRNRRGGK